MKDEKDVKICFHTLIQKMYRKKGEAENRIEPLIIVGDLLKYICKLSKTKKFYELKNNKFCFIESCEFSKSNEETIITGLFKSARNEFRPNLINKKNGDERKNPKEITEGDIEVI